MNVPGVIVPSGGKELWQGVAAASNLSNHSDGFVSVIQPLISQSTCTEVRERAREDELERLASLGFAFVR